MKTIYIGVIGAGAMGERHCRVCANLPRVELVGVTDLNEERGRQVADRYDTTFFSDRNALLAQVEAIIIAASTPVHYSLTGVPGTRTAYVGGKAYQRDGRTGASSGATG